MEESADEGVVAFEKGEARCFFGRSWSGEVVACFNVSFSCCMISFFFWFFLDKCSALPFIWGSFVFLTRRALAVLIA